MAKFVIEIWDDEEDGSVNFTIKTTEASQEEVDSGDSDAFILVDAVRQALQHEASKMGEVQTLEPDRPVMVTTNSPADELQMMFYFNDDGNGNNKPN